MAEEAAGPEIDERTGLKKKPPSSQLLCIMNHLKCSVGSGIFAMGFGFKNAGMIIGPPVLVLLGLISLHCQHLILQCGQEVEKHIGRKPDFAETGHGVFEFGPEKMKKMQKSMKIISNAVLIMTQTGVLCVYIIFFGDSMMRVAEYWGFSDLNIQMWILIAFVPITISSSTLGNLKLVGYLSIVANCLIFTGIVLSIYLTSTDPPEKFTFDWVGDLTKFPMFLSIGILAFTAIQIVLPIYMETKHPEKVGSLFGVLNVSTIIEIVLVVVVAVLSYRKYGNDCKGSVTLNFELGVTAQIVVICIGTAVMLSYTLNIYVIVEAVFPLMADRWGPFRYPHLGLFLLRLSWIVVTFILAWTLPMLGQIVALVGAFGNTTLSIIFPAFFHIILLWKQLPIWAKSKDFLILGFGIFCLVAGIVAAIMDIEKEIYKIYNPEAKNVTKS